MAASIAVWLSSMARWRSNVQARSWTRDSFLCKTIAMVIASRAPPSTMYIFVWTGSTPRFDDEVSVPRLARLARVAHPISWMDGTFSWAIIASITIVIAGGRSSSTVFSKQDAALCRSNVRVSNARLHHSTTPACLRWTVIARRIVSIPWLSPIKILVSLW